MIWQDHVGNADFLSLVRFSCFAIFHHFYDGFWTSFLDFHLMHSRIRDWSCQLNSFETQMSKELLSLIVCFSVWSFVQFGKGILTHLDDWCGLDQNFCSSIDCQTWDESRMDAYFQTTEVGGLSCSDQVHGQTVVLYHQYLRVGLNLAYSTGCWHLSAIVSTTLPYQDWSNWVDVQESYFCKTQPARLHLLTTSYFESSWMYWSFSVDLIPNHAPFFAQSLTKPVPLISY